MTGEPQVTGHGGGVWSIPVPIPDNPLGHTLVYLLDTDRGPVLIDTGWDDPQAWDLLVRGLAQCGTSVEELHGVLITHHHPDHHGLSGQVRERSGAWLAMHPADTAVVRRGRDTSPQQWLDYLAGKLAAAGAPPEHTGPLWEAARDGDRARDVPGLHAALPDREIVPGELLDLPGRTLRAVWTPGHTPGHVCLHLEERHPAGGEQAGGGRLFSGDHLLPDISPHIGLYEHDQHPTATPGTATGVGAGSVSGDPLGDYLASLERIARLGPAEVLPAHRYAFGHAEKRVRELLEHHTRRLELLRELLTGEPLTPWQLAERLEWNRPWEQIPASSRNIAVAEVEAHVRRLVRQGTAVCVSDTAPVTFQATD